MANLLARYTGIGLTPTEVIDSAGGHNAGNSGVTASPVAFSSGGDSLALAGGAAGDYFVIPATAWDGLGTFALAFYINISNPQAASAFPYFFCEAAGAADINNGFRVYSLTTFNYLYVRTNGIGYPAAINLTKGVEHLIVVQRNGATGLLEIFIDDMVTAKMAVPNTPWLGGSDKLLAGARYGWSGSYDGLMGDVRIFDAPLTQAERQLLTSAGAPAPPAAPVASAAPWPVGIQWLLTLTGAADLTTDVLLPAKSVQARLRSGRPSYLSVVVPYTAELADAVLARPNGDLQLVYRALMSDGVVVDTAVVDTPVGLLQIPKGAENASITMSGDRQTTNAAPVQHTVQAGQLQYLQTGSGSAVARETIFRPEIKPGDTLDIGGTLLVIDTINVMASAANGLTVEYSTAG